MPFIDPPRPDLGTPFGAPEGFAVTPGEDDLLHGSDGPKERPSWSSTFGAAFRQDNTVGSFFSAEDRDVPTHTEEGFKPWEAIKGTKYEQFWESFVPVRNSRHADALKAKIDREIDDRKTLDAAPWYQSLVSQMLAGTADLPSLLPGGAFIRGAKGGFSVVKSAATVGAAAGVASGVQEGVLQGIQETRPIEESAVNIGASVFLGGLLGAGGAKLLSRTEFNAAARGLERALAGETGAPDQGARFVYDDILGQLQATGMPLDEASQNAAVVAARYATRAKRLGQDPVEIYRAEGVSVVRADDLAAADGRAFYQRSLTPDDIEQFSSKWESQGVRNFVSHRADRGEIHLGDLVVKPELRSSGLGSQFMEDLTRLADETGRTVTLTPAVRNEIHGTTSQERLKRFYKRFGFVENKGRNKDFTISDTMYRRPKKSFFQIRAYHGSPHDFDRFDLSKIGTGEGAQAYGHGLYFAENEGVARSYRDALSMGKMADGSAVDWNNPPSVAAAWMRNYGGDKERALKHLRSIKPEHGANNYRVSQEAAVILERGDALPEFSPGRMYEVAIHADPERFLDWDRPLREQSEDIQLALAQRLEKTLDDPKSVPLESYFEAFERGTLPGPSIYSGMGRGTPQSATDALREAGIPGIRYLDQGSRSAGEGSRNYVVFDDKLIEIIRKYQRTPEGQAQGRITFGDNKAVIELFQQSDRSTFMHEASHLWLEEMVRDAAKSADIKSDVDTLLKWFGVDDVSKITTEHHEKWARAFERYLAEGKAPSSVLGKAFAAFKDWLTTIYRNLRDLGAPLSDDVRGVMDRMLATDAEIAAARSVDAVGAPQSAGAAAVEPMSLEDLSIAGTAAGFLARITKNLNPGLRLLHSPSAVVRETFLRAFDSPLYLKMHMEGRSLGNSAEKLMAEWNAGLRQAVVSTDEAWREHRKAGGGLSNHDFREAVGRAMRRGDQSDDPYVAKVAQAWRSQVFDPLKEAAIKAGLLPEDVTVETAATYFSRMWNRNKLVAREGEFKQIVRDWVSRESPKWAEQFDKAAERRLNNLRREIDELEMTKLRRSEELRAREQGGEVEAGEFTESDIRNALRIVQGGAPKPKGVTRLTQWVRQQGGLVDDGGELAQMGINNRSMPGLLRTTRRPFGSTDTSRGGLSFEDMTTKAWEAGFFPESIERPSYHEFLDALSDDFNKHRAVVRPGDREAFRLQELIEQLEADLARVGATPTQGTRFATSEEVKGIVSRVYKAMDAETDQKIARLKDKLAERQNAINVERDTKFVGDPQELGHEIANEVFNTLTGRTQTGSVRPEFITIKARGPLKERTFNIPDELVEDFLESDVDLVGRRYVRVMGADVEIANKFGKVDLSDQIASIRQDYDRLRNGVTSEKELTRLRNAEKADIRDLEALRDLLRGTRIESPLEHGYGKIVRAANHVNYIRSMGEVVIASITEAVRPAMVHGMMPFLGNVAQLATNMNGIKLSVAEAQLAGNVAERVLGHRMATITEIIDPYSSRGPVEAMLENLTNVASKWNGIRLWTDGMKSIASVMTQNRILNSSANFGKIGKKERAYLAFLGIDQSMAERIAAQFAQHGEVVERVAVANTEEWTDQVAVRAYRAAMNKDVDSIVVQRSVADVPLFAHTPTGKAILQFKSFALASHQRVLLRGLQEDQARFVGGVVSMTMLGMLAAYLKALSGNRDEKLQDFAKNPGWWVGEGLDRSGIFAVPMEAANTIERAAGVNFIKSPLKAFDEGDAISQKIQNRNQIGALLGPSAGLVQDTLTVMGIPQQMSRGEDITQAQKNAGERLVPFNSYAGARQFFRYLANAPE